MKGMRKMVERQSKAKDVAAYLIPAILALIGVIVGSLLTSQLGLQTQPKINSKQKRLQAYSELMGRGAVLSQLITSNLVANTHFQHQVGLWWLAGESTRASLHLEEARKWMHEAGETTVEIIKSRQSLYETLGLIRSYFPYSPTLKELTHKIYRYKMFEINERPHNMDAEQLENWKNKTINEIREATDELDKLIDELVIYLETEIEKDAS